MFVLFFLKKKLFRPRRTFTLFYDKFSPLFAPTLKFKSIILRSPPLFTAITSRQFTSNTWLFSCRYSLAKRLDKTRRNIDIYKNLLHRTPGMESFVKNLIGIIELKYECRTQHENVYCKFYYFFFCDIYEEHVFCIYTQLIFLTSFSPLALDHCYYSTFLEHP